MAKQVRITLAKAIAKANLRRAETGEKAITMNSLAVITGVASTTITRLARNDDKVGKVEVEKRVKRDQKGGEISSGLKFQTALKVEI